MKESSSHVDKQPIVGNRDAFFETIARFSAEGISVANEDGQYIYVNPAFCEIMGYSVEELLQMTVFDVKSKDQDKTTFSRTKSSKEGLPVQVSLQRKDGSDFLAEVLGKVMQLDDETIVVGIVRDITDYLSRDDERLLLERQLQHAQKLESLGVLAGGIAHDFNNLLMVILGNTDLALNTISPMSSARQNLIEIEKASRRAADLSKQMLAYSGKGEFVVGPIDLYELVNEMAHLLKVSISKKVTFNYNLASQLPIFNGDATQISQVIMNLITNASESIGDDIGTIALTTGLIDCDRAYLDSTETVINQAANEPLHVGTYLYIDVTDSGCGMDEETVSKIFDPFFTTKFTGRGLGMSAVQGIVRRHSGAIKVTSEIGIGSTFRILFYIDETSNQQNKESTAEVVGQTQVPNLMSGTILLVDDEKMVSDVGQQMLEYLGFEVLIAVDGEQALDTILANKHNLDCILLDLVMPKMGGEEVFKKIRQSGINIPVIFCSGYSDSPLSKELTVSEEISFMNKPFNLSSLRKELEKVFDN